MLKNYATYIVISQRYPLVNLICIQKINYQDIEAMNMHEMRILSVQETPQLPTKSQYNHSYRIRNQMIDFQTVPLAPSD